MKKLTYTPCYVLVKNNKIDMKIRRFNENKKKQNGTIIQVNPQNRF